MRGHEFGDNVNPDKEVWYDIKTEPELLHDLLSTYEFESFMQTYSISESSLETFVMPRLYRETLPANIGEVLNLPERFDVSELKARFRRLGPALQKPTTPNWQLTLTFNAGDIPVRIMVSEEGMLINPPENNEDEESVSYDPMIAAQLVAKLLTVRSQGELLEIDYPFIYKSLEDYLEGIAMCIGSYRGRTVDNRRCRLVIPDEDRLNVDIITEEEARYKNERQLLHKSCYITKLHGTSQGTIVTRFLQSSLESDQLDIPIERYFAKDADGTEVEEDANGQKMIEAIYRSSRPGVFDMIIRDIRMNLERAIKASSQNGFDATDASAR